MRQIELFYTLMKTLQDKGVLKEVVLVGSWCQYFYQEYFGYSPQIPAVRTVDIDFLIPNPPYIKREVNVTELLESIGFVKKTDHMTGLSKFSHDDLVVEFLFPEQGRGKKEPYEVSQLHINAVGLRFLNLLQSHLIIIEREGISVRLPEPAAFVLHKHIVSTRRKNEFKREKDRETAIEIGDYLLELDVQKEKLKEVFNSMPEKWQKTLLEIVLAHHKDMYFFLRDIV